MVATRIESILKIFFKTAKSYDRGAKGGRRSLQLFLNIECKKAAPGFWI
jgi:hypothetical protein